MNEQGTVREYQSDGTFIDRPMNAQEIQQNEKDHAEWLQKKVLEDKAKADKAVLLDRLGITADEAKLLLS